MLRVWKGSEGNWVLQMELGYLLMVLKAVCVYVGGRILQLTFEILIPII